MKFTVDMLDFTKAVDLLCDLFGGSLLSCTLKRAEHGQQGGETSQKKNGYFRSPMPQFPDIYNHLYRNIMKYILLYEYIYAFFFHSTAVSSPRAGMPGSANSMPQAPW